MQGIARASTALTDRRRIDRSYHRKLTVMITAIDCFFSVIGRIQLDIYDDPSLLRFMVYKCFDVHDFLISSLSSVLSSLTKHTGRTEANTQRYLCKEK